MFSNVDRVCAALLAVAIVFAMAAGNAKTRGVLTKQHEIMSASCQPVLTRGGMRLRAEDYVEQLPEVKENGAK